MEGMTVVGKTIAHYKIIKKLGTGGMGEVYLAEDLKLKRKVALKFLPPFLSTSEEDKQRFIQEAQTASALDHPNIYTIFDIGETAQKQLFIAMAYYEGETLKAKIAKRPLPLKEVVDIATQIAAGLSKAHEAGIIHRDIKPANIIVTKEGEVKIVDFGLAKLSGQTKLTKPGSTLGTISYMSPEQLKGEKVDSRSDIWSLGVVMYEMITGQLPFKGDYEQAITYAVLNEEPEPITALRTGVPMTLEGIVMKALAKDPKHRYQHVDEMPVDLQNIETRLSGVSITTTIKPEVSTTKQHMSRYKGLLWVVITLITLLLGILIGRSMMDRQESQSVKRSHIVISESAPIDPIGLAPYRWGQPAFTLSPDGTNLVYVANTGETTQLFLRPMDGFDAVPMQDTGGAFHPFFSPDGQWIGFFSKNTLNKVSIKGGAPIPLCEVTDPFGGSWGSDNRIIFVQSQGNTLAFSSISSDGSSSGSIPLGIWTIWPHILPGDKAVLASSWPGRVSVVSLDTDQEKFLLEGNNPRYVQTGHLIFEREGRLEAVLFDPQKLEVKGSPISILDNVRVETGERAAQFSFSNDGTLVYLPGGYQGIGKLTWVDRHGNEKEISLPFADYGSFKLSPNGQRLAIEENKIGGADIWIYDLKGSRPPTKLTLEGNNRAPIWTPDGESVVFTSERNEYSNIFRKRTDGSREIQHLTNNRDKQIWLNPTSLSPDGNVLAFERHGPGGTDIMIMKIDDESEPQPFYSTTFVEHSAVFSPDGQWIAYNSNEQGEKMNVYVAPYPATGDKKLISMDGGYEPQWSRDSMELFYWNYDVMTLKWMVINYETKPTFKPGMPQELFKGNYLDINGRGWDVSKDGQWFLLLKPGEEYNKKYTQLKVVTNWFEELKRKVPTGNRYAR
jgi:serine/threonine-protein kinase